MKTAVFFLVLTTFCVLAAVLSAPNPTQRPKLSKQEFRQRMRAALRRSRQLKRARASKRARNNGQTAPGPFSGQQRANDERPRGPMPLDQQQQPDQTGTRERMQYGENRVTMRAQKQIQRGGDAMQQQQSQSQMVLGGVARAEHQSQMQSRGREGRQSQSQSQYDLGEGRGRRYESETRNEGRGDAAPQYQNQRQTFNTALHDEQSESMSQGGGGLQGQAQVVGSKLGEIPIPEFDLAGGVEVDGGILVQVQRQWKGGSYSFSRLIPYDEIHLYQN